MGSLCLRSPFVSGSCSHVSTAIDGKHLNSLLSVSYRGAYGTDILEATCWRWRQGSHGGWLSGGQVGGFDLDGEYAHAPSDVGRPDLS